MLTFLRKIRRSLIDSGSTGKYLMYALGEVLLVVLGILIALQINNWNEERKTKQTLAIYLNNLKENIESDIIAFKQKHESSIFRYYATQYLIRLAGHKPYDPSKDEHTVPNWKSNRIWKGPIPEQYHKEFIEKAFLWTHRVAINDLNRSTVEELKSTGMYSKLDKKLKDALRNYHNNWEFRFGKFSQEGNRTIIVDWQASLHKEGTSNSNPFLIENPIRLLEKDPEKIAFLRLMAGSASWWAMSADILIEEANDLMLLIDEQLPLN